MRASAEIANGISMKFVTFTISIEKLSMRILQDVKHLQYDAIPTCMKVKLIPLYKLSSFFTTMR